MLEPLGAQVVGNWLPPVSFTVPGSLPGCGGTNAEKFYVVHASVIPVGPHRGKVLVWDRSASDICSLALPGGLIGDRDQRWAIVDPDGGTATLHSVWTIPHVFAPPVHGGSFTYPFPGTPIILTSGYQYFAPATVGCPMAS